MTNVNILFKMDILEIELLTDNIEETSRFYSGLLGFEKFRVDAKTISFRAGQSLLTFNQSDNINPKYHFAFNIPCNKLDEAITWISSMTKLIHTTNEQLIADFTDWNAKSIYFNDNNGNILEFIARFDLNNLSEKPFDISSIESISEIGIVADKPLVIAEKFITENNLSYFSKGAKSDTFIALGGDLGLFVIVKTNRNWFPTNEPAVKYFTKIKVRINNLITDFIMND
jgi:catechol 2,3-dioxygenase-like lactoylglutathione lyase family enzyme